MAQVAVVIPNWNGAALLPACLDALRAQTAADHEVVVVDNGSTDNSHAILAAYPAVRTLALPRNLGFGAATNAGIRATSTPLVATLNNDAVPSPDWLAALLAAAAAAPPRVGMWASRMVFAARPDRLNSCGIAIDRTGIAWDLHGGASLGADARLREPFGPCAGAALYRRALLDDVGLFEARFFAYLEDVDLAWRARARGWRCAYVPGAQVVHHHSATAGEGSAWKQYLLGRNKVWLLARNFPAAWWPWLLLAIGYDLAAVGYAVARRRDLSALRGRLAGLRGLGWAVRSRRGGAASAAALARVVAPPSAPWRVPARYHHLRAPSK